MGEFVNADLLGPLTTEIVEEAKYVSCLIDRFSSYASVETMATKSSATIIKHLKEFQQELQAPIKTLRTDNGREYINGSIDEYLKSTNIRHETTTPYSPSQNGKVERFNRTLIEKTKTLLHSIGNQQDLWPYAVDHATYIYNRTPHSGNPNNASPFEMIQGYAPDVGHLKPFGTKCWIDLKNKTNKKKLDSTIIEGMYIGHPKHCDGYLVLADDGIVHTSRYVKFAEEFSDYTNKSTQEFLMHSALLALEPTPEELINDPINGHKWLKAIDNELQSHIDMDTFTIIPNPDPSIKPIGSKLIFKSKLGPDNEVIKEKVRMVIQGFTQKYGKDFDQTSAPVIDLLELYTMLTLAAKDNLEVHQIDIKTAYLNAPLQHDVYIRLPKNLPNEDLRGKIAKLNKAVYGLKQAGFEWFTHLKNILLSHGWLNSPVFPCTYKRTINGSLYFILVYVDDILIFGKDIDTISAIKDELRGHFDLEDSGEINYFLGMNVIRDRQHKTFHLDQTAYIDRLLHKFQITKTSNTPCSPSILDFPEKGHKPHEQHTFQSKLGALLHLSRFTCPSITFAVNYMSRRASCPSIQDHAHLDRIFHYLNRNKKLRFSIIGPSHDQWEIKGISDADYAEDRETSQSTSGFAVFIGGSMVSWGSKRQNCVSESTTESEYVALSRCAKKTMVIKNLLDFIEHPAQVTLLCDNMSTIAVLKREDVPPKLKHIRVKYHAIIALMKQGHKLEYIPTKMNTTYIYTKPLNRSLHDSLRTKLNQSFPDSRYD